MVVRFAALMAAVAVLAGCGQKGPLYLPDKGGEVVTRPGGQASQQQAPQSSPPGSQSQPAGSQTTPGGPAGDQSDDQKKKDQQNPRD